MMTVHEIYDMTLGMCTCAPDDTRSLIMWLRTKMFYDICMCLCAPGLDVHITCHIEHARAHAPVHVMFTVHA